jgi:hypothetical protein
MDVADFDFKAALAAERRDDRRAGALFAKACADGDVAAFYAAIGELSGTVNGWYHAMRLVGRRDHVSDRIKGVFLPIWIEHKNLPLTVGHRPTMAKALRVLMPRNYSGPALPLYRGTTAGERRRHLYGFSWTARLEIARDKFAEQRSHSSDAVVLETLAPPEAILHVRRERDYFDEDEVVVDPFRLGQVKVLARLPGRSTDEMKEMKGCSTSLTRSPNANPPPRMPL